MHFKTGLSKNTFQTCSFKNIFQNAITKTFFISASINAVNDKISINKSLIMHD